MIVDKVGDVSAVNSIQNAKKASNTSGVKRTQDEISVSEEGKARAEEAFMKRVADETPDVRADLVEQVKRKIMDPNYLNEATIAAAADNLLSAYGL